MKENVLDVLMYLLDRFDDDEGDLTEERQELSSELVDAGFSSVQIDRAFDWLESLGADAEDQAAALALDCRPWSDRATRVYADFEQDRLSVEARGFITSLGQNALVDKPSLERIVDRALALDVDEIDVDTIRWIAMMVLCNHPETAHLYACLEELTLPDDSRQLQ